jgi:hypothetical protein
MNKNIINKYIKLLLIIINNVDPIYKYYLKIIFLDLWSDAVYMYTGISWRLMEKLKNKNRYN